MEKSCFTYFLFTQGNVMAPIATASSVLVYPPGYMEERPTVEEKIDILRGHFPGLNPDSAIRYWRDVCQRLDAPSWATERFVMISSGFFSDKPAEEAQIVLGKIPNLQSEFLQTLNQNLFKRDSRSVKYERMIADLQPGDLWIIPGQFGSRHCGVSAFGTKDRFLEENEFVFGSVASGCALLTHPRRLDNCGQRYVDWISLGGDRCRRREEETHDHVPRLKRGKDSVIYDIMFDALADDRCGTPTGVVLPWEV